MHPWLSGDPYPVTDSINVLRPSSDIVTLVSGLAGVEPGRLLRDWSGGHEYAIRQAIAQAAGLTEFGICPRCQGSGTLERYPGQKAEAEAWRPVEPPAGDGWQLWETVSEGSPISPVFATDEELTRWMSNGEYASKPYGQPLTYEQAAQFVKAGWAPSAISTDEGFFTNELAIGDQS